MRTTRSLFVCLLLVSLATAQQRNQRTNPTSSQSPTQSEQAATPQATRPGAAAEEPATAPARRNMSEEASPLAADKVNTKFDMKEVAPVVTHHSIKSASGKTLNYTATTGRLPIKDGFGNIEAEMFFVAYTLDGQDASKRPVTFAFNGGPGSASIWLHMGALGPRKVTLQNEGWMPQGPYKLMDNPYTPLDQTDLVLVDAIGTGYSRPLDVNTGKKFWGLKGDIEGFGEFIRMYISRYDRWSSPLFLLGESYGTTRAAGIAGYLVDKGIAFNGITLLSTIIDFQSVITTRRNDEGYIYTLPTFTSIAWYHKKLPSDLQGGDLAKARAEAEQFASGEYATALAKGDALSQAERQNIIDKLARYTGLKKDFIDQQNLRVDVRGFTSNLLIDQKLFVGRLDGRYSMPNPSPGPMSFFDPSSAATTPPFVSVFNDYVRRELGYKVDMPYYTSARDGQYGPAFTWSWGEEQGFADTASALRSAMIKNPFMKVQVMEGYYDLATPYYAVNYTMDHLDLAPQYHKNISFATYEAGHMVYLHTPSLEKMHKDYTGFVEANTPR